MKKTREEIIDYINALKDYQGYVQFSHRPIDKDRDIFIDKNPKVENENGFTYEAHFYNGKDTITIKQINEYWLVDETKDIPLSDIQSYITEIKNFNYRVRMAQIWEEENDELCEGMKVKRLKRVVFAGFEKEKK